MILSLSSWLQSLKDGSLRQTRSGSFFPAFLKFQGWTKAQLAAGRPTNQRIEDVPNLSADDLGRLISLNDLFQRVPEISKYYEEVTGKRSMTAHVFHSSRNMAEKTERDTAAMKARQTELQKPNYTWIGIAGSTGLLESDVTALGLPFTEWQYGDEFGEKHWEGKFAHDSGKFWHEVLPLHHSAMSPTSWIAPITKLPVEYLSTNFMLLYGLSILTRYRPRTWREIVEGQFDTFRPLVLLYLQVVDRVLPQIALERISGRRVVAVQPGSLFAPT